MILVTFFFFFLPCRLYIEDEFSVLPCTFIINSSELFSTRDLAYIKFGLSIQNFPLLTSIIYQLLWRLLFLVSPLRSWWQVVVKGEEWTVSTNIQKLPGTGKGVFTWRLSKAYVQYIQRKEVWKEINQNFKGFIYWGYTKISSLYFSLGYIYRRERYHQF